MAPTSFEAFREYTGWKRPGHDHGCPPVEVVPGVWTAHYHDIDTHEKLVAATKGAPIKLVVNSALSQCACRTGFYGPDVIVMEIDLEDDPNERKYFDQGKPSTSTVADKSVPLKLRCAGDAKKDFTAVSMAIEAVLASGGHVLIHCMASLSRSPAFVLSHIMRTRNLTLLEAAHVMKPKWDAVWPCDRFTFQLIEYEAELAKPNRFSQAELTALLDQAAAAGALPPANAPAKASIVDEPPQIS
jgi:protein-tyrosine phosphatase